MPEQCVICGSKDIIRLENQTDSITFKVGDKLKKFVLTGLSLSKCQSCGEGYLNPKDCEIESQKLLEALANERRRKGLLTGEEIREIRVSLGFTQVEFEKLLGLGAKSFVRWENYKTDQSKSADLLLRAIKKGGKDFLLSLLNEKRAA